MYPDAPLLSEVAKKRALEMKASMKKKGSTEMTDVTRTGRQPLHEVFKIPSSTKGVTNGKGKSQRTGC